MNTPSHFLINAALRRAYPARHDLPGAPFLLGAVLPDVPLTLLAVGTLCYVRLTGGRDTGAVLSDAFDNRYFHDPLWIAAHNLFHAPTLLALALGLLWPYRRRASWLRSAFWLCAGCAVHSLIDLATHHNDGPLLFFPFEWTIRFQSPVSYWDRQHYGGQFFVFEVSLDLLLLAYLAWSPARRRLARKRAGATPQLGL